MLNTVALMGRFTRDPELKKTPNGKSVTSFTLAANNRNNQAEFFDCVAWNATAENLCKFFHKGDKVGITGRLSSRTYENNEGKKVKVTEVIAEAFDFCESKKQEAHFDIDPAEDFPF